LHPLPITLSAARLSLRTIGSAALLPNQGVIDGA
jgi:hypothetical protein